MSSAPSRLEAAFLKGHPALVAYLMGGYPDRAGSLAALVAVACAGADVIELGVPYADPLADGPVIQHAAEAARACEGSFGLAETLDLAGEAAALPGMPPLVVMTYLNPMMRMGLAKVGQKAAEAGVAGFIVPDMPPDNPMAVQWKREAVARGIDTVFLAAPTSTPERLAVVGEASTGFVYVVSSLGVTGERTQLPAELTDLVARVRASSPLPVAVGFGVSTPAQAATVSAIADGVIVGSALVRRQDDPSALGEFVGQLVSAVHTGGR
ncbi:MAG: tryptophan synthase subunit alpha [Coriobacteriia bacterium]|nr:tryptophan synthase subunit alpha [Coriobacteriia bacterium]MBN2822992.1 tryptophan synthase subunit alpha [Coriobacteriia bacterium]